VNTDYVRKIIEEAAVRCACDQPSPADWANVEGEMGVVFPADYKALVSALGEGAFGCGLNLRNPCSTSEYTRLSRASLLMHRESIADLEAKLSFPIYPSAKGAVAVGSVDRQDIYLKPGSNPKELTELVWLNVDTEEARTLPYTLSQFLYLLYRGAIPTPQERELGEYLWRGGQEPFFLPAKG
jgi:hypothetical protein